MFRVRIIGQTTATTVRVDTDDQNEAVEAALKQAEADRAQSVVNYKRITVENLDDGTTTDIYPEAVKMADNLRSDAALHDEAPVDILDIAEEEGHLDEVIGEPEVFVGAAEVDD